MNWIGGGEGTFVAGVFKHYGCLRLTEMTVLFKMWKENDEHLNNFNIEVEQLLELFGRVGWQPGRSPKTAEVGQNCHKTSFENK